MDARAGDDEDVTLIYAVGRVNHGIRRDLVRLLRPWGLSIQEYTALSVLKSRPGLSNAQLARRTLVSPQSMIEILARLESRSLVTRTVDPAHRRILRAEVTAAGAEVLREAQPVVDDLQDRLFDGVPPAERRAALSALRQAMAHLSGR